MLENLCSGEAIVRVSADVVPHDPPLLVHDKDRWRSQTISKTIEHPIYFGDLMLNVCQNGKPGAYRRSHHASSAQVLNGDRQDLRIPRLEIRISLLQLTELVTACASGWRAIKDQNHL